MSDQIEQEFVMHPLLIPSKPQIVDILAKPSDKESELNSSMPSVESMLGSLFC